LYTANKASAGGSKEMKKLSLQEVLEGIEDTRREGALYEVLFIMPTAVICGAISYVKVEMFGESKENWLKKYLKLENGIPDTCTFQNVIKAIDTQRLHEVFVEWMLSTPMRFCSFSPKGKCQKTPSKGEQPLNNYT